MSLYIGNKQIKTDPPSPDRFSGEETAEVYAWCAQCEQPVRVGNECYNFDGTIVCMDCGETYVIETILPDHKTIAGEYK